ncbi:alpha/beta hydrolase [Amycolatopsis speibonae]|uniref:Alpha/beta hydrolase n=1 Tax=Amycolatopsis speibonae TaxID=1450224 RepID=A0ABV7P485_9PSEU
MFLAEYARRSEQARANLKVRTSVRYGSTPPETLDFFPAAQPDAPLVVFVHGGYWRELDKADSAFPALGLVPAGVAFAALNYGLAPAYQLDEIVAQVRKGLWWLVKHAVELNVAPDRVHVSGSCAGAHLVAMALLDGWFPGGRLPADVFAGAILLSGVYDLEPIRLTYVNSPLGLSPAAAARLSPIGHLPDRLPPLVFGIGGAETAEFTRQHREFVATAAGRTPWSREVVVQHRNHFDIPFDLDQPTTELGAAVFDQIGL